MSYGLKQLEYHLLPGKVIKGSQDTLHLYNLAYSYWKTFWSAVLKDLGSHDAINPDDFIRQDFVACLFEPKAQKIVSLHLYTLFDIRSIAASEHSYISHNYSKNLIQDLRNKGITSLISFEYMTVDPEWRKSKLGYSLVPMMTGLGLNILKDFDIHAAIAPARKDVRANEAAYHFGFRCLEAGITKHNVPCDIVLGINGEIRPSFESKTRDLIENFWIKKFDHTNRLTKQDTIFSSRRIA